MKLSVIIVNYNVQHFLEQCLLSVEGASEHITVEVIVVDNASVDGSIGMLKRKFPQVTLIKNEQNVGFAKANNQGIKIANGEYILLLNPDTIVEEDTFRCCIAFMDEHQDAGALGVKMIDGSGHFLPESKRGFPSPAVAFYKATGLSRIFPQSRIFNQYHLGYLDQNEIHKIDVLAGAFIFTRKSVFDEVGYLDEDFFMYGEDIDLSFRIKQAGYENYYLPDTTIVHFKGESTKKGSVNYIRTFYNAMIIFANKHLEGEKARSYILLIKLAIIGRGMLSFLRNLIRKLSLPVMDILLIGLSFHFVKVLWARYYFMDQDFYGFNFYKVNLPFYALVILIALFFGGGYDRKHKPIQVFQSLLIGALILFALYGLLPLKYRSSRAILSIGILVSAGFVFLNRLVLSKLGWDFFSSSRSKRLLIVGKKESCDQANTIISRTSKNLEIIGYVSNQNEFNDLLFLNSIDRLDDLVQVHGINEIVFCADDIASSHIIYWMKKLGRKVKIKILPMGGFSIIGSHSKKTSGELYTIEIQFNISEAKHRRIKRTFDLLIGLFGLILSPILILFQQYKLSYFTNMIQLIIGQKSLVSYHSIKRNEELPSLKKGILKPSDGIDLDEEALFQQNFIYAKNYNVGIDLQILHSNLGALGTK